MSTNTLIKLSEDEIKPLSFGRVVKSEWIKFRSLRSSKWTLGSAFIGMILIACLISFQTRHLAPNIQANDRDVSASLQGWYLAMYIMGSIGVLFVSGEYGTGMIRSTFTAVPKRTPVIAAKTMIIALAGLVTMVAACLSAFLISQAFLNKWRPGHSLSDPTALRVVIGTGVFLTLVALLGSGLGWLIRSTPGALVTFFVLSVALPSVIALVLGNSGRNVSKFTPIFAGGAFITSTPEVGRPSLSPWAGLATLVVWVVVAIGLGILRVKKKDA